VEDDASAEAKGVFDIGGAVEKVGADPVGLYQAKL